MIILAICFAILSDFGASADDVQVQRIRVAFGVAIDLTLNASQEYIVQFEPNAVESFLATRISVETAGASATYPVLASARQRSSLLTWRLPAVDGSSHIERTLCPFSHRLNGEQSSDDACDPAAGVLLSVDTTLQLSTSCAADVLVSVRADAVYDFALSSGAAVVADVALAAPRYYYYSFGDESRVQLVVQSDDDLCAYVAVLNYSCPMWDDETEFKMSSRYMTVQKKGGLQIAKQQYPNGFYVALYTMQSDSACTGSNDDLFSLLEAVLQLGNFGLDSEREEVTTGRTKTMTVSVEETISTTRFIVVSVTTIIFFGAFYLIFGIFVLIMRTSYGSKLVVRTQRPQPIATIDQSGGDQVQVNGTNEIATMTGRRWPRRGSDATFDSEDLSDSESDGVASQAQAGRHAVAADVAEEAGEVRPWGLPRELRLAALAQRRARILRSRANRYLWTLLTVAVFYALPVVQLVATYQGIVNTSGELDLCYYNSLCSHPLGEMSDFNHLWSNAGYILLGGLYILLVARRQRRQNYKKEDTQYGIPQHFGILYSLGTSLMVVGVLSTCYHVCPNKLNFQFDTAFMYVMAVLSMVKIYQSRHPDVNARAHATFGVLAVIIALGVFGVLGGSSLFWGFFTVIHLATFLLISLQIYYVGQFRLDRSGLQAALPKRGQKLLYQARFTLLMLFNIANCAYAIYGLWTLSEFASHLLILLLLNTGLYTSFYVVMKLLNGERMRWHAWVYFALACAAWFPGLYFFTAGTTNWAETPASSRNNNRACELFHFYDTHDLWHFLSAIALFFTFTFYLTWDDGLSATPRTEIAVF